MVKDAAPELLGTGQTVCSALRLRSAWLRSGHVEAAGSVVHHQAMGSPDLLVQQKISAIYSFLYAQMGFMDSPVAGELGVKGCSYDVTLAN